MAACDVFGSVRLARHVVELHGSRVGASCARVPYEMPSRRAYVIMIGGLSHHVVFAPLLRGVAYQHVAPQAPAARYDRPQRPARPQGCEFFGERYACVVEQRGRDIRRARQVVPERGGRDHAGPGKNNRRSESQVMQRQFAFRTAIGVQNGIVCILFERRLLPAIVVYIRDQGVFAQASGVDMVEQRAKARIEPGAVRVILPGRFGKPVIFPWPGVVVRRMVRIGRVQRRMGQRGGVPDKERLFRMPIYEIEYGLHGFSSRRQSVAAHKFQKPARLAPVVLVPSGRHSFCKSSVFIRPFPPFSRLKTCVALVGEQRGQRREPSHDLRKERSVSPPPRVPGSRRPVRLAAHRLGMVSIRNPPILRRIQARNQGLQRRPTIIRRGVGQEEGGPFVCQSVQVRGAHVLRTRESKVGESMIVPDDQHDIRGAIRCLLRIRRPARRRQTQRGEERKRAGQGLMREGRGGEKMRAIRRAGNATGHDSMRDQKMCRFIIRRFKHCIPFFARHFPIFSPRPSTKCPNFAKTFFIFFTF